MNYHESTENTQMVIDDQDSYIDQHTLNKTIAHLLENNKIALIKT